MPTCSLVYRAVESLGYRVAEECPPIILPLSGYPVGYVFCFCFLRNDKEVVIADAHVGARDDANEVDAEDGLKFPLEPKPPAVSTSPTEKCSKKLDGHGL